VSDFQDALKHHIHGRLAGWAGPSQQQHIDDAIDREDWQSVLWQMPKGCYGEILSMIAWKLADAERAALVREAWTGTENPYRDRDVWLMLFTDRCPREQLMTAEDLACYRALAPVVEIWRGSRKPLHARGLSWTVEPDIAAWYARRYFGNDGRVYNVRVLRESIIAYFAGRGESEVIVNPNLLPPLRKFAWTPEEIAMRRDRCQARMDADKASAKVLPEPAVERTV
jgi:hypothetical protein